jgi:hypothetical protein
MHVIRATRLIAVPLFVLGLGLPVAKADGFPAPVADPGGLLLPLPECGSGGVLVPAGLAHRVRDAARRHRPARQGQPPAALPAELPEMMAWQAFLACTVKPGQAAATPQPRPGYRT